MKTITIRITEEQYNEIKATAEDAKIPTLAYARLAMLSYPEAAIENIKLRLQIALLKEDIKNK